jgi:transposase
MNPYPQNRSVLILDNCAIHKSAALREVVEAQGMFFYQTTGFRLFKYTSGSLLIFLPPYSPDLNPIEESFSAGKHLLLIVLKYILWVCLVKAWIRRHWARLAASDTPEVDLLEACGSVTDEKARGWFRHSGYM